MQKRGKVIENNSCWDSENITDAIGSPMANDF
jgi:hypothetical protein